MKSNGNKPGENLLLQIAQALVEIQSDAVNLLALKVAGVLQVNFNHFEHLEMADLCGELTQ